MLEKLSIVIFFVLYCSPEAVKTYIIFVLDKFSNGQMVPHLNIQIRLGSEFIIQDI